MVLAAVRGGGAGRRSRWRFTATGASRGASAMCAMWWACCRLLMAQCRMRGRVFNLGSDEPIQIQALAELVRAHAGQRFADRAGAVRRGLRGGFDDLRDRRPDLTRIRAGDGLQADRFRSPDHPRPGRRYAAQMPPRVASRGCVHDGAQRHDVRRRRSQPVEALRATHAALDLPPSAIVLLNSYAPCLHRGVPGHAARHAAGAATGRSAGRGRSAGPHAQAPRISRGVSGRHGRVCRACSRPSA